MTQLGSVLDLNFAVIFPTLNTWLVVARKLFLGVKSIIRRVHCMLSLVIAIFLKYYLIDHRRNTQDALHTRRISMFFVAFMLYPTLSHRIFQVCICRRTGPHEVWLEQDYSKGGKKRAACPWMRAFFHRAHCRGRCERKLSHVLHRQVPKKPDNAVSSQQQGNSFAVCHADQRQRKCKRKEFGRFCRLIRQSLLEQSVGEAC